MDVADRRWLHVLFAHTSRRWRAGLLQRSGKGTHVNPIPCWPVDDDYRVRHRLGVILSLNSAELRWRRFPLPLQVWWAAEVIDDNGPRPAGCLCQWEQGDSPCPVHGDEELGPLARSGSSLGLKDSGVHPPGGALRNATDR